MAGWFTPFWVTTVMLTSPVGRAGVVTWMVESFTTL